MTPRISQLRNQSIIASEHISAERAKLITAFYKKTDINDFSIPVQRAKAFEYLLLNKKLFIGDGELIVGERGAKPKATPTYPEINLHSLDDLDVLDSREKVAFKVSREVRDTYHHEIIPFWTGKSNREKVMESMSDEWLKAYKAGIFTEFQEQRAPGHTILGYKMYSTGFQNIIDEIDVELKKNHHSNEEREQLKAMKISAGAIIKYAHRHAKMIEVLAQKEPDLRRKAELTEMARICRKVPAHAPETVHEMLQHYWFIHLGVITELNPWDSFNPGRLDQHLCPVYQADMERGVTNDEVKELIQAFWIKFNNHPAPPKVGVTAKESNTYTDFCLINIGGVTPEGENGVNEISYLLLDVIEEMRLLQPSSMIQVSEKNPDKFIHRALKITKTGFGQPSVFNTEAIIQELLNQGKHIVDARNGGASGCVETGAFGTESYFLTGYFNLVKVLEITLNNGFDSLTNEKTGIETGKLENFTSYSELLNAFKRQLNYFIDIKLEGNNRIEKIFAENLPAPFLSTLIEGCIVKGKDYNAGGAKYNTSYVQGVGLGTITDALTALKYHIFENKTVEPIEFSQALKHNFKDFDSLRHQLVYNTPKYGNDHDFADNQANDVFNLFYEAVNGKPTFRGGVFRINMLPTTCHVYFGQVTGATPDGRLAHTPVSEGISPVQGADKLGPTAVLNSAAKIDHLKTGGTLLNQKFTPSFFEHPQSYNLLTALIRSYFKMNGHHIQFNVVSAETLKKAQKQPELYGDLIVRVAGYSDYFNDLGEDLQNEIIRRTEHSHCADE